MKTTLTTLLLFIVILAGCKKEKKSNEDINSVSVIRLEPSQVTSGTIAKITGTNFGTLSSGIAVFFEGKPATVRAVSETEIQVVVPVTKSGEVNVVIGNRTIKGPAFIYTDQGMITEILPSSGSEGALVRIIGSNFGARNYTVSFNGVEAEVMGHSASELLVKVPVTTTGNVVVSSGGISVQGPIFNFMGSPSLPISILKK